LAPDVEQTLHQWETAERSVNITEVRSWAQVVRAGTKKGDLEVLDRLIAIIDKETLGVWPRYFAVIVACEIADEEGSRRLEQTMRSLLERLEAAWEETGGVPPDGEPHALKSVVVAFGLHGAPHVMPLVGDHRLLLDCIAWAYISGWQVAGTRAECIRLIKQCQVPPEVRQDALARIIERAWRRGAPDEALFELVGLLDNGAFPKLRELVRAGDTPETFHFGAADVLSFFGDAEIIADLEARRPAFHAQHRYMEEQLMGCIWRIEVQKPPTKLLDYIASVDSPRHRDSRAWAVRRAAALGVAHERIRNAILEHAQRTKKVGKASPLVELKWTGLQLGILKENDLPEVEIPPKTWTE